MDAIIKTLFQACGKMGIAPSEMFADVQAFRDHIHRVLSTPGKPLSREQLLLLQDAVIKGAYHDVNAVIRCLDSIRRP